MTDTTLKELLNPKPCTKCGEIRAWSLFGKDARASNGIKGQCKVCLRLECKEYNAAHPEERKAYAVAYGKKNKKRLNVISNKWYRDNKEQCLASQQVYRKNNRKKINATKNVWRKANPQRGVRASFSTGMCRALHSRGSSKAGLSSFEHVPYTFEELCLHLESNFQEGMSWENYGKDGWHLDHNRPDSWFTYTSTEDLGFQESWALSNLQPMWAEQNISKGNRFAGTPDNRRERDDA